MTKSVTTGLAVAAMVLTLGGTAFAQGASVGTKSHGSGQAGAGRDGVNGSLSGSNRASGRVTAPGAGAGIDSRTTGQGSVGVGGSGIDSHLGAGSKSGAGAKIRR